MGNTLEFSITSILVHFVRLPYPAARCTGPKRNSRDILPPAFHYQMLLVATEPPSEDLGT